MGLRARHGNAKNVSGPSEVLETLPVEELPVGVAALARPPSSAGRAANGKFETGNPWSAEGGKAKAGWNTLARERGYDGLTEPYKSDAKAYARATCTEIANTVGGGICGALPSSLVVSAALALAWSRKLYDTGEHEDAKKQAEAHSSFVRQAHEYAAKQAIARPKKNGSVAAIYAGAKR